MRKAGQGGTRQRPWEILDAPRTAVTLRRQQEHPADHPEDSSATEHEPEPDAPTGWTALQRASETPQGGQDGASEDHVRLPPWQPSDQSGKLRASRLALSLASM